MTAPEAIEVEVLFFARARELSGLHSARIELPAGATVAAAAKELARRFPRLAAGLPSCRFAVNEEFASDAAPVPDGSVLAVIPPVSGGV